MKGRLGMETSHTLSIQSMILLLVTFADLSLSVRPSRKS